MERKHYLDAIRGSFIGGAMGDALGYTVEFLRLEDIYQRFGPNGITEYCLHPLSGNAHISDDTQMSLFTANGILVSDAKGHALPHESIALAYQDWLYTQDRLFNGEYRNSWLLEVQELYSRRAPGNTCLSALQTRRNGECFEDYFAQPINHSKGCGGIMRVAPLALRYNTDIRELDREAVVISAITHGHPLGYIPSAVLVHIINRIVYPNQEASLKDLILEAKETVCDLFCGEKALKVMCELIDSAVALSQNDRSDVDNIRLLGEGWVAEETLAIALYCALRYENDFSAGLIAAVNHDGDSDSTGAVVGNILGAIHGYASIDEKWKKNLELSDVLLEVADDLCFAWYGDPSQAEYENWERKYCIMRK